MATIEKEIRDRIQRFVNDMNDLVRRAAMEAVNTALAGSGRAARGVRIPTGGSTGRRTPQALEAVQDRLLDYVRENPGLRIEQINEAIGTSTREVRRPLTKLLASGRLRREGEKRASRYYVGSGRARKKSGRKKTARKPARKAAKKRSARKKTRG